MYAERDGYLPPNDIAPLIDEQRQIASSIRTLIGVPMIVSDVGRTINSSSSFASGSTSLRSCHPLTLTGNA